MKRKELKDYFERDKKYREKSMVEMTDELIRQVDYLKMDLLKNKKRLGEDANKETIFSLIEADIKGYIQRFNLEKIETIGRKWESSNEVVKALEHLEKNEKEGE